MSERRAAPTVGQVVLGRRLQELRETAGLRREEAAKVLRVAPATVRRMETAEVALKIPYVQILLTAYGVAPDEVSAFVALAEEANQPGWWQRYHDVLPDWFSLYVSLEGAARIVRSYEPHFVPGLLQTEDYARSVLEAGTIGSAGGDAVERHVSLRMERQRLLERPDPPHLWVVMDETVLKRPVSIDGRVIVARPDVPGDWPASYEDAEAPGTPAWQETHTSVPAAACVRIAREFARTAERSKGRCMILMGAGTNHWFHSETIYRSFLALLQLTGCQGRNGGGWAHYVGQEKCRPVTGWASLAAASDWSRPPRQAIGTGYWYLHTDQWRYDRFRADVLASPLGEGRLAGMAGADCLALSARTGWMPSYPTFDRNPLELGESFGDPVANAVAELRAGTLKFAGEDPDAPQQLAADRDPVAGQPARLLRQGRRVLHQAPAGHPVLAARRGGGSRRAAPRRGLARGGPRGQARPAPLAGLPAHLVDAALGRGAARCYLVTEPSSTGDHPVAGRPSRPVSACGGRRARTSTPSSSSRRS
ncbi:hypothetical protein STENM223S_01978 [Streptomyces tendae]